ncbi:MAG: lanthionine synthetase C family protein [Tumebacillaceae bacterium]
MGKWKPLDNETLRSQVLPIVRDVAQRLRDVQAVRAQGIELEQVSRQEGWTFHWDDSSLETGFPGQCLLFGEMSRAFPDEDWDVVGHQFLLALRESLSQEQKRCMSLYSGGLAGSGMAAYALSRQGERYGSFLQAIDQWMLKQIPAALEHDVALLPDVKPHSFETVLGWTGVGRYLLLRREEPGVREALHRVLDYLVKLCETREYEGRTIPGWFIPPETFDLGLAHGIPGPLALMALAVRAGVEVPGQRAAMRSVVDFLEQWKVEDPYGIDWPSRISWSEFTEGQSRPSGRAAWCYGTPGVARAIWLAGDALGEEAWKELAVEGFRALFRRPQEQWGLEAPNVCHGFAGLLQMTMRMYADTGVEEFATYSERLVRLVVGLYEPESPFGFADASPMQEGTQLQRHLPGFLEGASGTALVLLGLFSEQVPFWDAVLMIR